MLIKKEAVHQEILLLPILHDATSVLRRRQLSRFLSGVISAANLCVKSALKSLKKQEHFSKGKRKAKFAKYATLNM